MKISGRRWSALEGLKGDYLGAEQAVREVEGQLIEYLKGESGQIGLIQRYCCRTGRPSSRFHIQVKRKLS